MEDLRNYINQLRHDFSKQSLSEDSIHPDPILQFEKWFKEAVDSEVPDCNAFVLSTASVEGRPSGRVLLLRNFSEKGFVFYTNYTSKKASDLDKNPRAAITFFWPQLERQVRIEGVIIKQSSQESDVYFKSRPRGSKLGAWSSPQSKVIESRELLDNKYNELSAKYSEDIPRPEFWGGYVLDPTSIEFWQGRPSRMHDRIEYLKENKVWKKQRLAP